jgi:hypothetical protein
MSHPGPSTEAMAAALAATCERLVAALHARDLEARLVPAPPGWLAPAITVGHDEGRFGVEVRPEFAGDPPAWTGRFRARWEDIERGPKDRPIPKGKLDGLVAALDRANFSLLARDLYATMDARTRRMIEENNRYQEALRAGRFIRITDRGTGLIDLALRNMTDDQADAVIRAAREAGYDPN